MTTYIVAFTDGRKKRCASLDEVKELLVKRLNRPIEDLVFDDQNPHVARNSTIKLDGGCCLVWEEASASKNCNGKNAVAEILEDEDI